MMSAITIKLEGDTFVLSIPGVEAAGSHEVRIPTYAPELLIRVLSNQANASATYQRKIGFDASPTQYMVEGWLRANEARVDVREQRANAERRAAAIEAKYPGFDLSEIEI
jgi:hypothetical protein